MDLVEQWHGVLRLLNLPDAPQVLVASPDDEDAVLAALHRVRPAVRVVMLDIGPAGREQGSTGVHARVAASTIGSVIAPESVDLALLDHAVDDAIIEAVARHEGIEHGDRKGEHAPRARAVRAYWRSGDLERVALPALTELVRACERALRPSARMVFSHRVMAADLPSQPMDLYTDYLLLARRWVLSAGLRLREISLDGLDPHWWMCVERAG